MDVFSTCYIVGGYELRAPSRELRVYGLAVASFERAVDSGWRLAHVI
jgi:hypothetical protein